MNILIDTPQALGRVVRAVRKSQGLRQDDAAGSTGVSENFLGKLERGGASIQLGKVMQVLEELGIRLYADVPDSVASRLSKTGLPKP